MDIRHLQTLIGTKQNSFSSLGKKNGLVRILQSCANSCLKFQKSGTLSEVQKQGEITLQVLRDQEIFLYVLVAAFAQTSGNIRMGEQERNLVSGAFEGMGEQAGMLMNDLSRDSTDSGGDHGFLFPESFGNGEAETFAEAFLDDDGGGALEGVHFERRPRRKFEKFDIGIAFGGMLRFF